MTKLVFGVIGVNIKGRLKTVKKFEFFMIIASFFSFDLHIEFHQNWTKITKVSITGWSGWVGVVLCR